MPGLRSLLFWLHLVCGVVAGAVIVVMSATGVALTFEKQVLEWADRRACACPPPSGDARPLAAEAVVAAAAAANPGAAPTGVTRRAHPAAPITVTFDGNRAVLVNPYTGADLGEASPGVRRFFRRVTNWHRWLAFDEASRATGRAITGTANLAFLVLVLSGVYLWLPKVLGWAQVQRVLWFRRGLTSKARDFNWHNVVGVWSALPLAVVIAGAVPISFPWASSLVYRLAGDVPPAPQARAAERRPGSGADRGPNLGRESASVSWAGLDAAWALAEARVPAWRAITARVASPVDAPFAFTIEEGYGGQPQKRGTLTVDRATGAVRSWETFEAQSPGRRARTWLRFVHTGEYYGLAGQTLAGLVSAGATVLAYTGMALALRRFNAWRRRRLAPPLSEAA